MVCLLSFQCKRYTKGREYFTVVYVLSLMTSNPRFERHSSVQITKRNTKIITESHYFAFSYNRRSTKTTPVYRCYNVTNKTQKKKKGKKIQKGGTDKITGSSLPLYLYTCRLTLEFKVSATVCINQVHKR